MCAVVILHGWQQLHQLTCISISKTAAMAGTANTTASLRAAEHRTTWQAAALLPTPVTAADTSTAAATTAATIITAAGMAAGGNISTSIELPTAVLWSVQKMSGGFAAHCPVAAMDLLWEIWELVKAQGHDSTTRLLATSQGLCSRYLGDVLLPRSAHIRPCGQAAGAHDADCVTVGAKCMQFLCRSVVVPPYCFEAAATASREACR